MRVMEHISYELVPNEIANFNFRITHAKFDIFRQENSLAALKLIAL